MITIQRIPTPNAKYHLLPITPKTAKAPASLPLFSIFNSHQHPKISCSNRHNSTRPNPNPLKPLLNPPPLSKPLQNIPPRSNGSSSLFLHPGNSQALALCGFGYWIQGFRCFPWLALNFHLAQGLNLHPSTLQLVQFSANLPMVAKPLYGVLTDIVYIGGARRVPYVSFGVLLQLLSWGTLALIPIADETLTIPMACILLSNFGASFTEVAIDALVTEFSKKQKGGELQSFAFMVLAAGGILGNLSGGFFLQKLQQPKLLFLVFSLLLSFQLAASLATRENSITTSSHPSHRLVKKSISESLSKQFSNLLTAISEERIFRPMAWVVASIAVVPMLSGPIFCFQMQCLNLDPSIIGLSKVIGQLMVLSATVFYNRTLKRIPMRKLIFGVQLAYAISVLSDFFLATQLNLRFGISNESYVLCVSALAEAVAQFKILPFSVLFANVCPKGCEGSLIAFLASALCLSSIFSGFLGVGLANFIGLSSENYSNLPPWCLWDGFLTYQCRDLCGKEGTVEGEEEWSFCLLARQGTKKFALKATRIHSCLSFVTAVNSTLLVLEQVLRYIPTPVGHSVFD
ncbi:hypothetical protein ACLOJK_011177 [Asimina triloba]